MRLKFDAIAYDANAAIDFLRDDRRTPEPLLHAGHLVVPLFVWAELEVGRSRATASFPSEPFQDLIDKSSVLYPDSQTVAAYVVVRNASRGLTPPRSFEAREGFNHDLWIAALCLQHNLPLLTNDRDFDRIDGLEVIHW